MTDMSWANEVAEARMEGALAIWQSADRDAAIAVAIEQFGQHGEKRFIPNPDAPFRLSPPDIEVVRDPAYLNLDPENTPFKQGVVGYADDRIADGPANGWSSFDIAGVICPVTVIHGEQDWVVPVAHAHHTASIVRNSQLKTYPQHGHLSIGSESINALNELREKS
jgi:pimeloyl-ACP methyl ester carboxylesterase